MRSRHCFAVCAYGDSPYLAECLRSVTEQAEPTAVIMASSTPSAFLRELAARFQVPLYIREGKSSLRDDWNFALETALKETGAEFVTIAHQDDRYHRDYTTTLFDAVNRYPDLSLFCTRYRTINAAGEEADGSAERVKRLLRLPLRFGMLSGSRFGKRLCLRFGNAIACPTCTYRVSGGALPLFRSDYAFVIDWDTLWRLSGEPGRFVCAEQELLDYRVHDGAATKRNIVNHNREKEELEMFQRMWPRPLAKALMHFYKRAYRAYGA